MASFTNLRRIVMTLILKVVSYKNNPLPGDLFAEFDERGGSIGRKAGNTLVLPDPENFISGHHADVLYEFGQFLLKDTSTNGTLLVNAAITLNASQAPLAHNEIIRIGDYDLLVELEESAVSQPFSMPEPLGNPFGAQPLPFAELPGFGDPDSVPDAPFEPSPPASPFHDSFVPPASKPASDAPKDIADFLKGLDALGQPDAPLSPPPFVEPMAAGAQTPLIPDAISATNPFAELLSGLPNGDLVEPTPSPLVPEPFGVAAQFTAQPAPVIPSPIQEDVASPQPPVPPLVVPAPSIPEPVVTPVSTPASATHAAPPAPNDSELLRCFLEGAGIQDANFLPAEQWPAMMHTTGSLFRSLIAGLMDVLRARAEMKSEFRVAMTTIRSFDNNPLKFNPDVESVLKLMLAPNNPAFIDPHTAVEQGYRDIKCHQLAMTAGIQASLTEILRRFDPDAMEKALGEGIVFQKKAKCWEHFCEKYPDLKTLALEDFFGEAFAEAYEKQMRQLAQR